MRSRSGARTTATAANEQGRCTGRSAASSRAASRSSPPPATTFSAARLRPGRVQRGDHRLGARRHGRQPGGSGGTLLLVGQLRQRRHVRRLQQLRRGRRPHRARQVHLVDPARQPVRLLSGTSMAAPHVTGAAPCGRAAPGRTPGRGPRLRSGAATSTGGPRPTRTAIHEPAAGRLAPPRRWATSRRRHAGTRTRRTSPGAAVSVPVGRRPRRGLRRRSTFRSRRTSSAGHGEADASTAGWTGRAARRHHRAPGHTDRGPSTSSSGPPTARARAP